ncbi:MAG: helix-turn-helix domain-containing protein [Prevotellaceae bacterium]|nr:helix-turn-helix domain-containing protein [Prevotellaceae bacterium]
METKNISVNPLDKWKDGYEVMKELNISPRTLQNWRSNGVIGFSKVGHKIYYRAQDIDEMLESVYTINKGGNSNE